MPVGSSCYRGEASVTARILDGRALGAQIKEELRADIERFAREQGRTPGLVIVRVGNDTASGVYSKAILRVAGEVGLVASMTQLAARTTPDELRSALIQLNNDVTSQGIIVQMPLPAHLSQKMVIDTIDSNKDIDGISPRSAGNLFLGLPSFLPATAAAVIEILERARVPLDGKRVVVISRSNVVGKPLAMMLLQKNATVTVCHSRTANLPYYTRQADVLVAAAGHAKMVTADMVQPGATVIDVGINSAPDGGIVGDIDFEAVKEVAGALTPTPGGVGPLTNILLLKQCMQAAWREAQVHSKYRATSHFV
jgi:methylenetetrahydrofolate dehydrogenase (NADP+)/methenyltetrahydrofolate cyclohydrolase